jgi:hypothetical protein
MPPPKKRTPKDDLFEYGMRLLQDAENSSNPELVRLRTEAARKFFDVHLKGSARVSPRLALGLGLPVLLVLAGICIYSAIEHSGVVFACVLTACLLFALVILVLLLALCGVMGDSTVAKVVLGMFDKVIEKFSRAKPETEE